VNFQHVVTFRKIT